MDLAAFCKALHVSQDFLADHVFEHGLGGLVAEILAAAAAIDLGSDQMTPQAAAAMEAEVTGPFEKLDPLMQEKTQIFVKGDGRTHLCCGAPSRSPPLALTVSPDIRVSQQ